MRQAKWYPFSEAGLTLAELLITVFILAVITLIGISSYNSRVRYQVLQSASTSTADWLDNVRKRAMQQNNTCAVSISASTNTLSAGTTGNLCGSFAPLNLNELQRGSATISFCYLNADPLTANINCNNQSLSSSVQLFFSPRGSVTTGYVFTFFNSSGGSPITCTILLPPAGLIRSGLVSNNSCIAPT